MWIDDSSDSDSDYSESSSDSESEKSDQEICSDYEITSADLNIDIPDDIEM